MKKERRLPTDPQMTYSTKRALFMLQTLLIHIEIRKAENNRPETAGIYFELLEQEESIRQAIAVLKYHKRTFSIYNQLEVGHI